jgi:hypothetical protein
MYNSLFLGLQLDILGKKDTCTTWHLMRRQKILVHGLFFFVNVLTSSATCLTVAVVISGAVSAKGMH